MPEPSNEVFSISREELKHQRGKTNLPIIISEPCEDLVNNKRVVTDEIAVVGLKATRRCNADFFRLKVD